MANPVCYDSNGLPLKEFTQWDTNRTITVRPMNAIAEGTTSIEFQFCNRMSKETLDVPVEVSDDAATATVPDTLLQDKLPIIFHIFAMYEDGTTKTVYTYVIPIRPRKAPSEYEYTEPEASTFTWWDLKYGVDTDDDSSG